MVCKIVVLPVAVVLVTGLVVVVLLVVEVAEPPQAAAKSRTLNKMTAIMTFDILVSL